MNLLSRIREISYFARVLVKRAKYTNRQKKSPPTKDATGRKWFFLCRVATQIVRFSNSEKNKSLLIIYRQGTLSLSWGP